MLRPTPNWPDLAEIRSQFSALDGRLASEDLHSEIHGGDGVLATFSPRSKYVCKMIADIAGTWGIQWEFRRHHIHLVKKVLGLRNYGAQRNVG